MWLHLNCKNKLHYHLFAGIIMGRPSFSLGAIGVFKLPIAVQQWKHTMDRVYRARMDMGRVGISRLLSHLQFLVQQINLIFVVLCIL